MFVIKVDAENGEYSCKGLFKIWIDETLSQTTKIPKYLIDWVKKTSVFHESVSAWKQQK